MATIRSGFSPSGLKLRSSAAAIRPGFSPGAPRNAAPPRSDPFAPPIALYGEVTVTPGSTAEVSTGSISNSMGQAIEVREIRFTASIAAPGTNQFLNAAAVLRAMVIVNGKPLMAVPTPIWMLCRVDRAANQLVEEDRVATVYVMRLSRPMVLPPGAEVRCQFEHNGLVPAAALGGVCFTGKFTDRRETTTAVPYALFWASTFRSATEVTSEVSPEKNLANTLKTSIHVDRIIARHVTLGSGNADDLTGTSIFLSDGRTGVNDLGFVAPVEQMASLQLVTSRNQPIIKDSAPIWTVFETSGSLEIPHILVPKDFYRATVTTALPSSAVATALATVLTFRHQVQLSVVGWREEAI